MKTMIQLHDEMTAVLAELNAMPPAEAIDSEAWKTADALDREISRARGHARTKSEIEITMCRIQAAARGRHNTELTHHQGGQG